MEWHDKLKAALDKGQGVRFGEAAVVSRRVHTFNPAQPEAVNVLGHADAGQAFYGRSVPDQVLHLDLFHGVGEINHQRVAASVRQVCSAKGCPALADLCDVQTGTGGGRVTGALIYGQRQSLLASHRNHIHLAGLVGPGELVLLPELVAALEEEVLAAGLTLRRIERLGHPRAGNGQLDLSHYADSTDSLLRGTGGNAERTGGSSAGSGSGSGGSADGGLSLPASAPALTDEERIQMALRLARRLGSPDELHRIFAALQSGPAATVSLFANGTQGPFLLRELEQEKLLCRDGRNVRLTEAGQTLAWYFSRHLQEIKLRFRKWIRRVPRRAFEGKPATAERPAPEIRCGPIRGTVPLADGCHLGDLAVNETVLAGFRRARLAAVQAASQAASPLLSLRRQDLRVYVRSGEQPLYTCLLIDASASMSGKRILAAKHLVRHLLASTRDRIAVVGFQERDVKVHVPFTRDWALVEEGLARIQPAGLTPLAHGLSAGMELIQRAGVRRPLLLLITDGIPTVPKWSIDPLADALQAARQLGASRIPFGCIGLMPSRRYLEELAGAAGGTIHVVEELNEDVLVTIAHRERVRLSSRRH